MIISQHHPCPIFCPMPLLLCLHCFDAIFFIFLVHRYGKQYPGFGTLTVHMCMKDANWSDDPTNVITSHGYFSLFILVCKIVTLIHYCYRNWPRYSLGWSGWYCNPAQHKLCRHNECCAGLQYQPWQGRRYKWSISILPRSQFYKKQGKLAFSTSCTSVRPHGRLRNDA